MKNTSFKSYLIGFILSIVLTLIPYFLVTNTPLNKEVLLAIVLGVALLQLVVQLIFFLHLGREEKPRWNLIMLISTLGVVVIVVAGALWIMYHLNYNMMPGEMEQFLIHDEGIHK